MKELPQERQEEFFIEYFSTLNTQDIQFLIRNPSVTDLYVMMKQDEKRSKQIVKK